MKLPLATLCLVTLASTARAITDAERELQRITQEHSSAIATATEPINRRCVTALQQLLRRATQSGDLGTALKIKDALQVLEQINTSGTAAEGPPASRIINSTWKWWGDETITFLKGGKVHFSKGETWTWMPGTDEMTAQGETLSGKTFTVRFSPDFTTGKIDGCVSIETHRVPK